ncbi:GNAT family N-acetyltransferase [Meridianimarinicoccus roseus]|uniref:GNAT family N-acetyltransferase n=1 Tax=Meridianimarinicoccus roseus TaxID=2072018 RepID=A0A2V2LK21_9RHOB|nr:GNAT family N-acetyltransferase [Meridianimarinicoccus roseus]PWR03844.1 GNAT family N-acetyltransferase [Meridianimarinicoccus roseus]
MADIPVLTTARLTLRAMRAADWPCFRALMASPRARHMGGPFDDTAAWGMFCADHAQWDLFGTGALMIDDRATGDCLGQVGVNAGPLFPERELGWFVYPQAEARGIAFEAASALRDWTRDVRRLDTLVSYVDPDNARSVRLAERLGAVQDPDAPRPDPDDLVFRHFRR